MNCCGSGAGIKPKGSWLCEQICDPSHVKKAAHNANKKNGRIQDELVSDYAKFRAVKPSILSADLFTAFPHALRSASCLARRALHNFTAILCPLRSHYLQPHHHHHAFSCPWCWNFSSSQLTVERRGNPISPSRFSITTDISCCRSKAMCMAVSPSSSSALTSLPSLTSSCTIPACPWMTARCRGV